MKILHVIPYFPPAHAFGGSPKVAYQMCRELVKKGHDVTVYASDARDFTSRLNVRCVNVIDGVKICYFKNLSMTVANSSRLFVTPKMLSRARDEIKTFDVVHLHEYRTFQNMVVHHYAEKFGVPYVLQSHGSLPRIVSKQRLKMIYDMFFGYELLRDASRVIALSRMEAQEYCRMGVSEEKIAIIPNGIDLSDYANLPTKGCFKKKFGINEEKKIVLYLGRIHKSKGIDLLVKAYAYLINSMKFKDVVLFVVGPDHEFLAEVRALVHSLGISDYVIFSGFISDNDKLEALVDADVFVTPTFYGFPVTFLEACATETPIITTTMGDTLEWIDGKVGYATPPTPYDLAMAIYAIISNDKLSEFSGNCREVVRSEFSLKKIVDRLEHVYREVA